MSGYRFLPPGPNKEVEANRARLTGSQQPNSQHAPMFWDPMHGTFRPFPHKCVHTQGQHLSSAHMKNVLLGRLRMESIKKNGLNKEKSKLIPDNGQESHFSVPAPWGHICVVAWGNSVDPPVLLVHGSEDNAATFIPLLRFLPKKFYYVALELPGMGRSHRMHPGMMVGVYDMIAVIDYVVKHFRWNSFAYIGHDLGAILGKLYNFAIPNKISKLVELDPINFEGIEPESFPIWYQKYFTLYYTNYHQFNAYRVMANMFMPQQAVNAMVHNRGISIEDAKRIVTRNTRPATGGYARNSVDQRLSLLTPPAFSTEYIRAVFLNIKTPTLHILSSESVKLKKFKNTDFLQNAANYPHKNYRCVQIDGPHDIHLLKPEVVAMHVSQFLIGGLSALDVPSKL